MRDQSLHITIDADAASDGRGFVGRVMIADYECYRTMQAYSTPTEALSAMQRVVGDALGSLLAGDECLQFRGELGHAPRRAELNLGLGAAHRDQPAGAPSPESGSIPGGADRRRTARCLGSRAVPLTAFEGYISRGRHGGEVR